MTLEYLMTRTIHEEQREIIIGYSDKQRLLVVCFMGHHQCTKGNKKRAKGI